MVREFSLINEKNETFSLMDIQSHCLLTNPTGLGVEYKSNYEPLGNLYIPTSRNLNQGKPQGTVNFLNYENYKKFIDFIEQSEKLKLSYKVPYSNGLTEFLRDINLQKLNKSEISNKTGVISEQVIFEALTLWYSNIETTYDIGDMGLTEMQWDFWWDTRFGDYKERVITFENDGHIEAPFTFRLGGYLINPHFEITHNGETIGEFTFDFDLEVGEYIEYSSVDDDLYFVRKNLDGTITNLFTNEYINLKNQNIFKVPKGTSEIIISADNNIFNAKVNVYKQYKAV